MARHVPVPGGVPAAGRAQIPPGTRRRRGRAALAGLVGLSLVGAGCSSAAHRSAPPTTAAVTNLPAAAGLPPSAQPALRAVVAPLLAPFGLGIQRVSVETDPNASNHPVTLSIYARPAQAITAQRYAEQVAPLARAVVPVMLARYPGLTAVDICQERLHPPPGDEPPPVTRVLVDRAHVRRVAWGALTLRRLRAASRGPDAPVQLYVDPSVGASAAYRTAGS